MDQTDKTVTKSTGESSLNGHQFSAGLALILSLSALMLGAYLWYFFQGPGNTSENDFVEIVDQVNQLDQTLSEKIAKLETQTSNNQESNKINEQSIDKLRANLGRDQTNWAVSETEHLLIIANNRLQLARDVDTALAALRGADYQLQLLGQPKFLAVRKAIAEEISLLEAVEKLDTPGIAIRLSTIANKVNTLPIGTETAGNKTNEDLKKDLGEKTIDEKAATNTKQEKPETEPEAGFIEEVWQDVLSLFRIRTRNDVENYKPLLSAEQSYFVRENLRLRLYGCQQALLASNTTVYQQNLKDSLSWIKQNFDTDSQTVVAVIEELEKLAKIEVELSFPDISTSLEKIRNLRNKKAIKIHKSEPHKNEKNENKSNKDLKNKSL